MCECSAGLLLDREEESGNQCEGDEPHRHDRLEPVLTEGLLTDLEEDVGGNAVDEESDGDGNGSFGNRGARTTRS